MAYPSFTVEISKRHVIVITGVRTQTVNICTRANRKGEYDETYQLDIGSKVDESDLSSLDNLVALRQWLELRGGERRAATARGTVSKLVKRIPSPAADDPWVHQAVIATEMAMGYLLDEFLDDPYLHRTEQSLQSRLFGLLADQWIFSKTFRLGSTEWRTQLLHTEWPETIPDDGAGRGSFDIALLAPQQLENATLTHFRQGRIDPPIVIEIGVDYGYAHLMKDHKKLLQSEVVAPYLIHFSRINVRDGQTEALIASPTFPVRTAYIHGSTNGARAWKRIHETVISERP